MWIFSIFAGDSGQQAFMTWGLYIWVWSAIIIMLGLRCVLVALVFPSSPCSYFGNMIKGHFMFFILCSLVYFPMCILDELLGVFKVYCTLLGGAMSAMPPSGGSDIFLECL